METGTMRLYGCGGAGINIASTFNTADTESGSANIQVVAIDTSRSNLKAAFNDDQCYILPNVDGSGKLRSENHVEIANVIKQILVQHQPEDFNTVVFSASGGSGSVIGPLLVSELLSRGCAVVAVVIGSDESFITANNTLNTLKSLDVISNKQRQPVIMYYTHNVRGQKRTDADALVRFGVAALAVLCSKQIDEMDTQDITNFLQYQKVTSVPPRLAALNICKTTEGLKEITNVIAAANIFSHNDDASLPITPEYVATGYTSTPAGSKSLHYAINLDEVAHITAQIQATVADLNTVRQSMVVHKSVVSENDNVTDTGLVL